MTSYKSITNNNPSVIRHPKLPLVILRTDYLAIAKGNYCAAKLLAILENWTNWFVRQAKPERWVKLTSEAINRHLLGEHNTKQIRKALKSLVSLGFIRQEKRRASRNDQSYFYWLDIERVQEAIDGLELPGEPDPEADYLKMDATLESDFQSPTSTVHTITHGDRNQSDTSDSALKMPETCVIVDPAKSTTSNGVIAADVSNSASKMAETLVVVDPAKSTTSNGTILPHRSGRSDHIEADELTTSLNKTAGNSPPSTK